jgi:aspartate/methionine/tyrosine aminotransferase
VYGADANLSVDDVALTAGCILAFVAAVMALADAGDEVVLPVPVQIMLSLPFYYN